MSSNRSSVSVVVVITESWLSALSRPNFVAWTRSRRIRSVALFRAVLRSQAR